MYRQRDLSLYRVAHAQNKATPPEPKAPQSFDMTAIDKTANPCTDFYQYACGNWAKDNPIPPDQVRWGSSTNYVREILAALSGVGSRGGSNPNRTPLEQKYGDFYASCMDTPLADKKGVAPLEPTLNTIPGLRDKKQLAAMLATLEIEHGTSGLFSFGVGQDQKDSTQQIAQAGQAGLGLPDRDYYLAQNPRAAKDPRRISGPHGAGCSSSPETRPKRPRVRRRP